jgi:hypothetical protein
VGVNVSRIMREKGLVWRNETARSEAASQQDEKTWEQRGQRNTGWHRVGASYTGK